jgi:RecA/RadA recombinase
MKDNDFLSILKTADVAITEDFPVTGYIDTGSYALNALISGSIYGGFPNNRVVGLAGEEATGKTYFALSTVKQYLIDNPTGNVVYFDTEFSLEKAMLEKRGIDANRVHLIQPETLQDFRTTCLKVLDAYEKAKTKTPILMVLDSLGNLPTAKEVGDAMEGKDVRDMTKSQIIRSIFRVVTQKLGRSNIPMIVCNHTYDVIGAYVPTKQISGGGGLKYAASTIITLAKSKDRDGDKNVVGSIIKARTYKSRYSKQDQLVELRLNFETGLDRYYGLLDLAEKYDIFKKVSTRYELPDGSKVFGTAIEKNPEKYFTQEILTRLDEVAKKEFGLGVGGQVIEDDELDDEPIDADENV